MIRRSEVAASPPPDGGDVAQRLAVASSGFSSVELQEDLGGSGAWATRSEQSPSAIGHARGLAPHVMISAPLRSEPFGRPWLSVALTVLTPGTGAAPGRVAVRFHLHVASRRLHLVRQVFRCPRPTRPRLMITTAGRLVTWADACSG